MAPGMPVESVFLGKAAFGSGKIFPGVTGAL